jgi:hypothetical protein
MPLTLAETIRVADSYALGDPTQPTLTVEPMPRYPVHEGTRQNDRQDLRINKRREDFPDRRYGHIMWLLQLKISLKPAAARGKRLAASSGAARRSSGETRSSGQAKVHFRGDARSALQFPHSKPEQVGEPRNPAVLMDVMCMQGRCNKVTPSTTSH